MSPARVCAQVYEAVGVRAQGMGGAFVAVADDAAATWWNPAGLAGGAYFDTILEFGATEQPRTATDATSAMVPAWRVSPRAFAAAFPSLGLSYYRLRISERQPFGATAASGAIRQDQGPASGAMTSLALQEFGATIGESIGQHFVLASTLRLIHGSFAASVAPGASLDAADALEAGASETHGDLDIGAMAMFSGVKLGVALKHVGEPSFGNGAVVLRRQARAGIAATVPGRTGLGPVTLAFDADLTRTPTVTGDQRHVAGGAEAWLFGRRLGLRGGVTANTIDEARASASGGVSVALRSRLYVDGQRTIGSDRALEGWGVALRVTF